MDRKLIEVLSLTDEQKKKFKKLRAAYKECEKAGIKFINVYGSLYAVQKSLVQDYGDYDIKPKGELLIELHGSFPAEYMNIPDQWTDDSHIVGLTKKGAKLYEDQTEI